MASSKFTISVLDPVLMPYKYNVNMPCIGVRHTKPGTPPHIESQYSTDIIWYAGYGTICIGTVNLASTNKIETLLPLHLLFVT